MLFMHMYRYILCCFLQVYEFALKEMMHLPDMDNEDNEKTPPRKIKSKKRPT